MNRRLLLMLALPLLALAACGPVTYTLPVEKLSGTSGNVNFQGTVPGIVTLVGHGDSDSALLSSLAVGMAERLEADLGLNGGSVPVYSMYAEEVDLGDRTAVEYLHAAAGVDFLVVADSLDVGEYTAEMPEEQVYAEGRFMRQTVVSLPYRMRIQVFDSRKEAPVESWREDNVMEWTLLSDAPLTGLRAMDRVDDEAEESFRALGGTLAGKLVPQWETVNKIIYVYNDSKWTEACRLAWLFEWDKALEIWYGEADSPDTRKAACAAHNISVACEILEMDDLAAEWKARAEKLVGRE